MLSNSYLHYTMQQIENHVMTKTTYLKHKKLIYNTYFLISNLLFTTKDPFQTSYLAPYKAAFTFVFLEKGQILTYEG